MYQLESALVIALRDTIKWEAGTITSAGTLTPVNPDLPFDAHAYQTRDRELAYRDLIVGAAVVEVSVQVGDVWNYAVLKPKLQGPVPSALPFASAEAGTYSSQVRHVTQISVPYDAARYADADLYGRDALIYEVLARACESAFTDPSIPRIDAAGTLIPGASVWSLAQGAELRGDINPALPLNRDLFKIPDQHLADRDNQLAGYAARLAQVLKNPFEHALRLYTQVEAYGTLQREPDIYALISDDGTHRVFQTEPAVPGGNMFIYHLHDKTLNWVRELVDEVHVPQLYAMVIPGVEFGQSITTLAQVPERRDSQYWRGKAGQIQPAGVRVTDTDVFLAYTNGSQVDGGYMQYGSASLTVPDQLTFWMSGSLGSGDYRISVLTKPNSRVEIAGAQNISNTSGTLGGVTFDVDVASGAISDKTYLVQDGGGIVYNGTVYLSGDTFIGTTATPAYSQYSFLPSRVRQYSVNFALALPAGPWNMRLEYTNLSGTTENFAVKAEYIASGANAVPVMQDLAPLEFSAANGNLALSPAAGMDVRDSGPFVFPVSWTGGEGQLHIRRLIFESPVTTGRYAITGTYAGSTANVDVIGQDKIPGVLRWTFTDTGSLNGTVPFSINYTEEPSLPLQIQQVQIQSLGTYDTTPLSEGFQSWRQECLDRAERVIQQGYRQAVDAYGTSVPTFRSEGSNWSPEASENWVSFAEVYTPRLREVRNIPYNAITNGRQYEVISAYVTYNGTAYTSGQKFYGVTSAGSVYSDGLVHQVGAFTKSKAGHVGRPCLMPLGLYYDGTSHTPKAYYDTPYSLPIIVACQPWMIEAGLYVAQAEFWMPEML